MSLFQKAAEGGTANRVRLAKIAIDRESNNPRIRPGRVVAVATRVRGDRRGAAAAEFALVLPVLLTLLFGTFEYGLAFFTYNSMQNAARDVGRQVAVNTMLVGSAGSAIRAQLPAWARDDATVTVQQSTPANPNTNVYTFLITMPMSGATPIQFVSRLANPTLQTELRMKQELPYVANP